MTGGLGFIGSNVALALVRAGADVVGDRRCASPPRGQPRQPRGRVAREIERRRVRPRRRAWPRRALEGVELVFNLAGQVSHLDSMADPLFDLDVNTRSQLAFLESLRAVAPGRHGRLHVDAPALRPAAVPPGRRGPSGRAGRRQRRHQARGRAVPPPVRRVLRAGVDDRALDERATGPGSGCATTSRASCRSSCAARCSARRSTSSATARSSATASTSTTSSTA